MRVTRCGFPRRTTASSLASASTCALTTTVPAAACSPEATTRRSGSTSGSAPPLRWKRHGIDPPRTVSSATSEVSSSQSGPSGSSVRLRWLPTQTPAGRSRPSLSDRASPLFASMTQTSGWSASGGSSTSVPNAASQRPSGDQAGATRSPRSFASTFAGPPPALTLKIAVCGLMTASALMSAAKAIDLPSGAQDGDSTSKSPRVSCRARAPRRAETSQRCLRRSRYPSSLRKSMRVIRRAVGAGESPFPAFRSPTRNRACGTGASSARLRESGLQRSPSTPCGR